MKIIIISLLLFSSKIYAEYIFVETEKSGDEVIIKYDEDKIIDKKVFQILNTLQYPQVNNKYFRNDWNLSQLDYQQIISSEYQTLKRLIRERTSYKDNFDLIYVPKVILEIVMSSFMNKNYFAGLAGGPYGFVRPQEELCYEEMLQGYLKEKGEKEEKTFHQLVIRR